MNSQEYLDQMAATANALDLNSHMDLISKEVRVFGVPGYEVIGYDDWYNQCKHEFDTRLLKLVSYKGLNVLAETSDKVVFKSIETVEGTDGTSNTSGIEFIIQKEDDGKWRVTQERVLSDDELENDIRCGAL